MSPRISEPGASIREDNPAMMAKYKQPSWTLSDDWAVSGDPYNWILQARKGDRWRAVGYYRTPELLLKCLHRQVSRTMPADPDLLQHLETAYKAGERLSDRLSAHVKASFGGLDKLTPQQAATTDELFKGSTT
jgi:hypothetical protein